MHGNRLFALVGVVIGIVGLFMKSLTTDGEPEMETLSSINPEFADGIPTIWGGLDTWAQVVLVLLIILVVVLCLRPDMAQGLDRNSSMMVAGVGVVLLAYAVVKLIEAGDKADQLALGFAGMAQAGAPTSAHAVSTGVGFFVLIVGTVLVTFGGAMGFFGKSDS